MEARICLMKQLDFLQNYLPLANAHANDFISYNLWENLLLQRTRTELIKLDDEELCNLSNKYLPVVAHPSKEDLKHVKETEIQPENGQKGYHSCDVNDSTNNCSSRTGLRELDLSSEWHFDSDFLKQAPIVNGKTNIYDTTMKTFPTNWIHSNIDLFLKSAALLDLNNSGIVLSLGDLKDWMQCKMETLTISNFMTEKKSHEVHILSDICGALCQLHDIKMVMHFSDFECCHYILPKYLTMPNHNICLWL